jgi:hypothetical protein
MVRTILGRQDVATLPRAGRTPQQAGPDVPRPPGPADSYATRLIKLIPTEVVSLYVTIVALLGSSGGSARSTMELWLPFVAGVLGTPFHLVLIAKVRKPRQVVLSTLAFVAWVASLGGPLETVGVSQRLGAVVLVLLTFALPAFEV